MQHNEVHNSTNPTNVLAYGKSVGGSGADQMCACFFCKKLLLLSTYLCRSFNSYIDYPNRGQSYEKQHDEFHNSDAPNRFLAYGALVGGPGADDKCAPTLLSLHCPHDCLLPIMVRASPGD